VEEFLKEFKLQPIGTPLVMEHGRLVFTLGFQHGRGGFLDLSFMPRVKGPLRQDWGLLAKGVT
jgi:hypothetical protein